VRRILLVTAREYVRMTTLPAFWIIAAIVPTLVVVVPMLQQLLSRSQTAAAYVLVDKSGQYAQQINRRLELEYQREVLVQLLVYAGRWRSGDAVPNLQRPNVQTTPGAASGRGSSSSDAMVEAFVSTGGAPAVLRALKPRLLASAPAFQPPPRPIVEIPVPAGVDTGSADRFGATIGPHFQQASRAGAGSAGLTVAVYIPADVDSGGQVRVWTDGPAGAALVQEIKLELTQALRLKTMRASGIDPLSAAQIQDLSVPVSMEAPETPAPGGQAIVHSMLPLALAYLLLISTMITGSMMLQGLVEERSNKLLEAVLACVSPRELMAGKLIGISAIGLSIVGVWIGAVVAIVKLQPSSPLGFVVGALASLWQTPWIAVAMIFYFLAGYLTIGMIFMAIGVTRDSMQEAQAYLIPVSAVVAVPSAALATLILRDPNGLIPRIFSWIPLYTPMVMLARLQSGVPLSDLYGTAAVLVIFGALELFVLSRLFEDKLIQTGSGGGFHVPANLRRIRFALIPLIAAAVIITIRHERPFAKPADPVAALHSQGESIFKTTCAACHDPAEGRAVSRAQSREQLASLSPREIVNALTSGAMKPMAASLSETDIEAVATYLTGRQPREAAVAAADPPLCSKPAAFSMAGAGWNGWSVDPRNGRYQPDPGLNAAQIPQLKVKWSLSYNGGNYGQPTVVGGRLFLTSLGGAVESVDAKTGCLYWRIAQSTPSRTTVSVGPLPGVAPSGYAAYFGDSSANVHAVDAATGAPLWKQQVDSHPRAALTGAPTLYKGRLYVPVSSYEEGVASVAAYSCCTFRGSVAALDAATGKPLWKAFAIDQPAAPTRKNSAGTQLYGPAGAAVWSSPTIDGKRGRLYFATGNSYTDSKEAGSDAVVAVDLESGRVIWRRQVTEHDNDLSGCTSGRPLVNCPTIHGHDYDFGSSPVLATLSNGKEIVLAGQKSGAVFGLDPDSGAVLWRTQVGAGGFLGGIEWGMASDGTRLYVANTDVLAAQGPRPGLFALDPATGKDLWYVPSPRVGCGWATGTMPCFNAQSAAPSAIPGVVFSGATDGHERAYASADGRILWDFDTARGTYKSINGVASQAGGSIDVTSGTIADGMLYLISGYRGVLGGGSNNVLLAFSVNGQ
jgi:polyvinyl alcohol dehydrogenase (cytochrome)